MVLTTPVSKIHYLVVQWKIICGKFQVEFLLYFIQYHTINTHIEPSLKQTQRLQIGLTHIVAVGEFVG
jgi:hypothetical protein